MLEKGLYGRYVPERPYESIGLVRIFRGLDQLLKRDILLAIWKGKEGEGPVSFPSTVGSTLEVLDYGKTEEENYVVYEYVPGLPLFDAIESQPLQLKEALGLVIQIIEMMQSLAEGGKKGIILSPENFWLTEKGTLKVLDFWDEGVEKGKDITELFQLLHRMIFGKVAIPLPVRQIIEEISLSYQGNPYVIRKTLKTILHREEKGENESFPLLLQQIHGDLSSLYHYIKNTQTNGEARDAIILDLPQSNKKNKIPIPDGEKGKGWFSRHRKLVIRFAVALVLLGGLAVGAKSLYTSFIGSGANQAPTPFQVQVPDVTGLTGQEAGKVLAEKGIQFDIYYEKSYFHKSGVVFKQSPSSGQYMYRSDLLKLTINQ